MTVPEKMRLRHDLITLLLAGCSDDTEYFKRLLVAQQAVTECLADFTDDFEGVDEE